MNLAALLIVLARWSGVFGATAPATGEGRVVGGHEAEPHSYPYIVSLQTRILWARAHFCGGTLLSESWVLTAGHCITESWLIRWLPMDAVAGAHNVDNFGIETQVIPVQKHVVHPEYKGGLGAHDIALLRTRTPFEFTKQVQAVQLPPENFKNYKQFDSLHLVGWGALRTTFFFPDLPKKLQEVDVTYMTPKECNKAIENIKESYESNPLDTKSNICTGPITGGIAACSGDSGGPLVYDMPIDKDDAKIANNTADNEIRDISYSDYSYGSYEDLVRKSNNDTDADGEGREVVPVILGIVSWGVSPCGEVGAPTVYTKVWRYLDFIDNNINS